MYVHELSIVFLLHVFMHLYFQQIILSWNAIGRTFYIFILIYLFDNHSDVNIMPDLGGKKATRKTYSVISTVQIRKLSLREVERTCLHPLGI